MSHEDPMPVDAPVLVVDTSSDHRPVGQRHVLIIVLTAVLAAGGTYWLWPSDAQSNRGISVAAPGTDTDAATSTATATTLDNTTSSSDAATTLPLSSTSSTTKSGGGSTTDPSEVDPEYCSWQIPNIVGRTLRGSAGLFSGCVNAQLFGKGPAVSFEFYTVGEPCTTDPAQFDLIASQTPSAGTPFGGGTVRFNLTFYRDCSITTTTIPAPFITPPLVTDPPTITIATTEPTTTP